MREARHLVKAGYTNVANVGGGMIAWQRAGLPTEARRR
jgi:rhodanese-related sulfurtransferase